MRKPVSAFWILLPLLLIACAKDAPAPTPEPSFPTESLPEAQKSALETRVYCDTAPGACNPAVAMLVWTSPRPKGAAVGACTAFLVSDDRAATNSHCIPKDLKKKGSDCETRLWLFFPQVGGYGAQKVECAEVLEASNLGDSALSGEAVPDYAILRLKNRISRPAVSLDFSGLDPGRKVIFDKVDPYHDRGYYEGLLRRIECTPVPHSLLLPSYTGAFSPMVAFGDCPVVHGNSGSPISDPAGGTRGIMQAMLNKDSFAQTLKNQGIEMTESLADMGIGTNLACAEFFQADGVYRVPPAACTPTSDNRLKPEFDMIQVMASVDRLLEQSDWTGKEIFSWNAVELIKSASPPLPKPRASVLKRFAPLPRCFNSPASWLPAYTRDGAVPRSVSFGSGLPVIELRLASDRFLRLGATPKLATFRLETETVFSPQAVQVARQSRAAVHLLDERLRPRALFQEILGICPATR